MEAVSIEELKSTLPAQLKKNVSPTVMARVNEVLGDPEVFETYRENLLGYSHVLQHGRFKMVNYVDAVKYVSYKLMGKNSKPAFALVFPEKMHRWASEGVESKDQASYITAYNGSKLVNLIYEQTLIPVHVLNRDNYQRAINTQIELMLTAKSEMVRATAANSVLTHLKPPETTKVDINISSDSDSAIEALAAATMEMVNAQKAQLKSGLVNAQDLAHQDLVTKEAIAEGEYTEVPEPSLPALEQGLFD